MEISVICAIVFLSRRELLKNPKVNLENVIGHVQSRRKPSSRYMQKHKELSEVKWSTVNQYFHSHDCSSTTCIYEELECKTR